MIKNIMFDLYGTLIDLHTDESKNKFWIKMAKIIKWKNYKALKNKYLYLVNEYEKQKEEIELLDVFKEIIPSYMDPLKAARIFRRYSTKYIKLYKGVIKLLNDLKNEGYNIYLLSNAQSSFTIYELKKLGIYDYFNGIAISSDYGYKKPNPKFYYNAIKTFDIKIDETIMIGNDPICDYYASLNVGLKAILLKTNQSPNFYIKEALKGFNCYQIERKIKALA